MKNINQIKVECVISFSDVLHFHTLMLYRDGVSKSYSKLKSASTLFVSPVRDGNIDNVIAIDMDSITLMLRVHEFKISKSSVSDLMEMKSF